MKTILLYVFVFTGVFFSDGITGNTVQQNEDFNTLFMHARHYENKFEYKRAILAYDSAYKVAKELNNKAQMAYINKLKGTNFIYLDQYDTAMLYLNKADMLAAELNNDTIQAIVGLNIAYILQAHGNMGSATTWYEKSLMHYKKTGDSIGMAKVYNELSILYKKTGDFGKGLENALKANYFFKKQVKYDSYIKSLISLGNIYEKLNDYDTAYSCFQLAYNLSREHNQPVLALISVNNIAAIDYDRGLVLESEDKTQEAKNKFLKSKSDYTQAIEISKSLQDNRSLALYYTNLSNCYRKLNQNKKAIDAAKKGLELSQATGNVTVQIQALSNLGIGFKKDGEYKKAKDYFLESLKLAEKARQKEPAKNASGNLANVYELLGDYKKALDYSRLTAVYQDSLFNEKKQKLIEKHKTNYEILHLKDLNRINELDKKRARAERNVTVWISVFIVVVLLGLLIFFRMRARKNRIISGQRIQKLEDEKRLMAAQSVMVGQEKERERIARELHDGIGVLLSTASIHFSSVESTADKKTGEMLKKANKLLKEASKEVRHISHNMMPGVLSKFGLKAALEDMFEDVEDTGDIEVGLRLNMGEERLPENMEIMLYRVIQEMLNNTLKHAKASKVTFSLTKKEDRISIEYVDNGLGFDENKLPKGKNLGLSGIRSRIDYLGGRLNLESHPGKGTRYFIDIPLNGKSG